MWTNWKSHQRWPLPHQSKIRALLNLIYMRKISEPMEKWDEIPKQSSKQEKFGWQLEKMNSNHLKGNRSSTTKCRFDKLKLLTTNGTATIQAAVLLMLCFDRCATPSQCRICSEMCEHECNTHVHENPSHWNGCFCAFLCLKCCTLIVQRIASSRSVVLRSLSIHIHTFAFESHYTAYERIRSPYSLLCTIPMRSARWFIVGLYVFVVLSIAFSSEHTFSANSCSNRSFSSAHEIYSFVRTFFLHTSFYRLEKIPINILCRNSNTNNPDQTQN